MTWTDLVLFLYLHGCDWVPEDNPLAVRELGVVNGDVPQGDVLVDEVLVHVALSSGALQLWPAETAGVGSAQDGAV